MRFSEDLLWYLSDSLRWIPSYNPAWDEIPAMVGLNWHGPTIIARSGGTLFQQVCASWSQLFALGPEQIQLWGMFQWQWPFDEEEHQFNRDDLTTFGAYEHLDVNRDQMVQLLTTLAVLENRQLSSSTSFCTLVFENLINKQGTVFEEAEASNAF